MSTSEQKYFDEFFNSEEDLYLLSLEYFMNSDLSGAIALSNLCISLNEDRRTTILVKSLILLAKSLRASQLQRFKYIRPLALVIWKCRPIPWKELMQELDDPILKKRICNYLYAIMILLKVVLIESLGLFPRRLRLASVKKRLIRLD